jgi:hypothetical protein
MKLLSFKEICFECNKQILREMGHNNSHATANNYVSIVEAKRKQNENIWEDKSIENSVSETISRGMGTDQKFYFNYSPQEQKSKNPQKTWFENLKINIQKKLSDIAPNLDIFEIIKNKFIAHFRSSKNQK